MALALALLVCPDHVREDEMVNDEVTDGDVEQVARFLAFSRRSFDGKQNRKDSRTKDTRRTSKTKVLSRVVSALPCPALAAVGE